MNVEIPARWYSFLGVRMTLLTLRLANSSSIRKGKCEAKLCKAWEWNLDSGEQIISFVQKKQKCKYCSNPRLLSLSWIIEFQFRNWPIPIFRYNENRPLSSRFSELNCLKTNKQKNHLQFVWKKSIFNSRCYHFGFMDMRIRLYALFDIMSTHQIQNSDVRRILNTFLDRGRY